jgi:hypothetical protein
MIVTPDFANLVVFVAAALVLLLTPGPAVLYIVTRSIDQGRRAGLVSMLGVHVGTLVHVGAAPVGGSLVVRDEPVHGAFGKANARQEASCSRRGGPQSARSRRRLHKAERQALP